MTKLEHIANTPVHNRKKVMGRIHCADGVSFSAQASNDHYAYPKGDNGPWTAVEVGFLVGVDIVPKDWSFVENHRSALSHHDHTGVDIDSMMPVLPIYTVDIDVLKRFIDEHGGEIQ